MSSDGRGTAPHPSAQLPILEAEGLVKHFPVHRRGRTDITRRPVVHAVDGVSLALYPGQVTALVGESGSGKSTVARLLAQVYPASAGKILLNGKPVSGRGGSAHQAYVRQAQLIFQDPFSSLNPVHKIRYQLSRPLRVHRYAKTNSETDAQIFALLQEVNLVPPQQFAEKFPHELSGGQLQRVAIARALGARPSVLLADEPVSMLDVSIRLGILNLLNRLATERHLALLYITHDIASARYFATTTLVMYAGQLIEGGPSETVTQAPAHPYTRLLIASAPKAGRAVRENWHADPVGEPPSLIRPPAGCRFHPRCPAAMKICASTFPPRSELGEGRWTNCWLHADQEVDRSPLRPQAGS